MSQKTPAGEDFHGVIKESFAEFDALVAPGPLP